MWHFYKVGVFVAQVTRALFVRYVHTTFCDSHKKCGMSAAISTTENQNQLATFTGIAGGGAAGLTAGTVAATMFGGPFLGPILPFAMGAAGAAYGMAAISDMFKSYTTAYNPQNDPKFDAFNRDFNTTLTNPPSIEAATTREVQHITQLMVMVDPGLKEIMVQTNGTIPKAALVAKLNLLNEKFQKTDNELVGTANEWAKVISKSAPNEITIEVGNAAAQVLKEYAQKQQIANASSIDQIATENGIPTVEQSMKQQNGDQWVFSQNFFELTENPNARIVKVDNKNRIYDTKTNMFIGTISNIPEKVETMQLPDNFQPQDGTDMYNVDIKENNGEYQIEIKEEAGSSVLNFVENQATKMYTDKDVSGSVKNLMVKTGLLIPDQETIISELKNAADDFAGFIQGDYEGLPTTTNQVGDIVVTHTLGSNKVYFRHKSVPKTVTASGVFPNKIENPKLERPLSESHNAENYVKTSMFPVVDIDAMETFYKKQEQKTKNLNGILKDTKHTLLPAFRRRDEQGRMVIHDANSETISFISASDDQFFGRSRPSLLTGQQAQEAKEYLEETTKPFVSFAYPEPTEAEIKQINSFDTMKNVAESMNEKYKTYTQPVPEQLKVEINTLSAIFETIKQEQSFRSPDFDPNRGVAAAQEAQSKIENAMNTVYDFIGKTNNDAAIMDLASKIMGFAPLPELPDDNALNMMRFETLSTHQDNVNRKKRWDEIKYGIKNVGYIALQHGAITALGYGAGLYYGVPAASYAKYFRFALGARQVYSGIENFATSNVGDISSLSLILDGAANPKNLAETSAFGITLLSNQLNGMSVVERLSLVSSIFTIFDNKFPTDPTKSVYMANLVVAIMSNPEHPLHNQLVSWSSKGEVQGINKEVKTWVSTVSKMLGYSAEKSSIKIPKDMTEAQLQATHYDQVSSDILQKALVELGHAGLVSELGNKFRLFDQKASIVVTKLSEEELETLKTKLAEGNKLELAKNGDMWNFKLIEVQERPHPTLNETLAASTLPVVNMTVNVTGADGQVNETEIVIIPNVTVMPVSEYVKAVQEGQKTLNEKQRERVEENEANRWLQDYFIYLMSIIKHMEGVIAAKVVLLSAFDWGTRMIKMMYTWYLSTPWLKTIIGPVFGALFGKMIAKLKNTCWFVQIDDETKRKKAIREFCQRKNKGTVLSGEELTSQDSFKTKRGRGNWWGPIIIIVKNDSERNRISQWCNNESTENNITKENIVTLIETFRLNNSESELITVFPELKTTIEEHFDKLKSQKLDALVSVQQMVSPASASSKTPSVSRVKRTSTPQPTTMPPAAAVAPVKQRDIESVKAVIEYGAGPVFPDIPEDFDITEFASGVWNKLKNTSIGAPLGVGGDLFLENGTRVNALLKQHKETLPYQADNAKTLEQLKQYCNQTNNETTVQVWNVLTDDQYQAFRYIQDNKERWRISELFGFPDRCKFTQEDFDAFKSIFLGDENEQYKRLQSIVSEQELVAAPDFFYSSGETEYTTDMWVWNNGWTRVTRVNVSE